MTSPEPTLYRSPLKDFLRRFLRHRLIILGSIIILSLAVIALFGSKLAPYDPVAMNFAERFATPSLRHPFGTDEFGRDVFSRVLYGAAVSFKVAFIAVAISGTAGVFLGAVAGFFGRWLDEVIMRFMDILFAFPAVLLAITVMAILGRGVGNAMIAIAIVYAPIFARVTRGAVISVRGLEYVTAARALGQQDGFIIWRHVLPNAIGPIIVQTSLSLAFAILAEAALSFFGLGTQPPDPSWGRMLAEGRGFLQQAPWMGIFPGLAIMMSVMGFNFLGDGLRDLLDPRLKQVLSANR
ncbi:MAG: ABC transporter permease [Trueperaceae bacterium]|nr:MAG: ABC transporter permease [Trueperaceae bacterium]